MSPIDQSSAGFMDDVLSTTALLSQGWIKRFIVPQDLRNMKTGITRFIAPQDTVIVIDANRRYYRRSGGENYSPQGEGGLPQRASRRIAPGELRAMSDVTEIPPPLVA